MVLFEIYQSFKGHFLNELRVFFKLKKAILRSENNTKLIKKNT